MRNKIFGTIGIIWGGGIVLSWLFSPGSSGGSEAYQAGQSGAVIFGVIMLALGSITSLKSPRLKHQQLMTRNHLNKTMNPAINSNVQRVRASSVHLVWQRYAS